MKIVIEIPTDMYENIRNGIDGYNNFICTAIRNGIPLPKSHEGLIDEGDAISKRKTVLNKVLDVDETAKSYESLVTECYKMLSSIF